MKTKNFREIKKDSEFSKHNFLQKNKSKPLYVLLAPASYFFYIILFLWAIKRITWVKRTIAPIWKVINIAVLSSPATVFISFILPIVFTIILANMSHTTTAIAGTIAQIPVLILVLSMPVIFVDFKRSSLLKRIFISNVRKETIILAFVTYFILISMISILIAGSIGFLLFWNQTMQMFFETKVLKDVIKYIKWGNFIFGIILNLFLAGSIGIIVSSYAKTPMFALAIGLLMLIPGGFLSGQYFSLGFVLRNKIMRYASFLFWQKYPTLIIISSFDVTNFGSGEMANYVSYDIFGDRSWEVINDFKTIFPPSLNKLNQSGEIDHITRLIDNNQLSEAKNNLANLQQKINGVIKLNIESFVTKVKMEALTPTMARVSIIVSAIFPMPIYAFGIRMFRWSTR